MLDEAIALREHIVRYTKAWGPRKTFTVLISALDVAGCRRFADAAARGMASEWEEMMNEYPDDDFDRAYDSKKEDPR